MRLSPCHIPASFGVHPGLDLSSGVDAEGTLAKDPVCGMVVVEGPDALKANMGGTTFYFCSDACLMEYTMPERELSKLKMMAGFGTVLTIPILLLTYVAFAPPGITNYVLLILAVPVQFLVGGRFYRGTYYALKMRRSNMDVLVAVGTSAAFFYSAVATVLPGAFGAKEVYFDAAAVIVTLVLTGKLLEHMTKDRASQSVRRLLEQRPAIAHLVKEGKIEDVPLESLVVGDVVEVKPGERVPTDGEVKEGKTRTDESLVTGESAPVAKEPGSQLIGSSINLGGRILETCTAVGQDTVLGQITKLVDEARAGKAPIQRLADRVAGYFVPAVLLFAIVASVGWFAFGGVPLSTAILVFVSVVIIACPCALGIATPAALLVGTGNAAKKGILVKNGEAVEVSAHVDTVLLDKTGTITNGGQSVVAVLADKADEILRAAAAVESYSEHTIGRVIVDAAKAKGLSPGGVENFVATPGAGVSGETNDGRVLVGRREFVRLAESWRRDEVERLQGEGNTVVFVSVGEQVGAIAIGDAVKKDARRSVAEMSAMGLSVMMLTGDDRITAEAVAKQVGLTQFRAGLLPSDKEEVIRKMQKEGKIVAMVGDGVNDAPALAKADLGLALGSGTDVAKETGGIVLIKDRLSDVVDALRIGRATMRKIRQNLAWAFGYNIILIPIAAGALIPLYGVGVYSVLPFLSGAAMAFSSASVVLNSLLLMRYSPRPSSSV